VRLDKCATNDPPNFKLDGGRFSNCWHQEKESAGAFDRYEISARSPELSK
jgi:hypothetical protein